MRRNLLHTLYSLRSRIFLSEPCIFQRRLSPGPWFMRIHPRSLLIFNESDTAIYITERRLGIYIEFQSVWQITLKTALCKNALYLRKSKLHGDSLQGLVHKDEKYKGKHSSAKPLPPGAKYPICFLLLAARSIPFTHFPRRRCGPSHRISSHRSSRSVRLKIPSAVGCFERRTQMSFLLSHPRLAQRLTSETRMVFAGASRISFQFLVPCLPRVRVRAILVHTANCSVVLYFMGYR